MAYVEPHGDGYRIVYRENGDKTHQKFYEPCPGARTKSEAREMLAQFEQRRWREQQGIEKPQRDLAGTLAELVQWWIDFRCPPASLEGGAISGLEKHVVNGPVGEVKLAVLKNIELDNFICDRERDGAMPGTLNNLRAQLHVVFAKAKKAGKWVGDNPVKGIEIRKVAKRIYITLSPAQVGRALVEVPTDWKPLFACSPALGLRKGELFALRKIDVDLAHWTITVCRSHNRDVTKGGQPKVLPIPRALRPWIQWQMDNAPGENLFPAPDGSQRRRDLKPIKILQTALARAGITRGWEHVCRWCTHLERAADHETRYCPTCLKTTDGRGNLVENPRGRKLWARAIKLPMRFHDLRHTFATELLRRGVDAHRVQRLMRHADIQTTTDVYSHLLVEDLREAVDAFAPLPESAAADAGMVPEVLPPPCPQEAVAAANGEAPESDFRGESAGYLERETGFEPATLSLGIENRGLGGFSTLSQPVVTPAFSGGRTADLSQVPAGLRRSLPPPCPQEPETGDAPPGPAPILPAALAAILTPPRRLRAFDGRAAFFKVREAAEHLNTSRATVYGLIERGELVAVKVGTELRIRPADLETYLSRSEP